MWSVEVKSGSSPKKCNWFGYDALLFLLPSNTSRGSKNTDFAEIQTENVDEDNQLDETELAGTSNETEVMSPGTENDDIFQTRSMTRRPKQKLKDDNVVNDALQCMKRLTGTAAQQDSVSVYGEHVANKLRACNSEYAVTVVQHHIDNILFNLAIGTYSIIIRIFLLVLQATAALLVR